MKAGYGLKFNQMQMNIKPDFAYGGIRIYSFYLERRYCVKREEF